ncbi:MAG: hypothetical protein ABSH32_33995 [Bryobacteraceae bacterium]|jgi:hypothetical protein
MRRLLGFLMLAVLKEAAEPRKGHSQHTVETVSQACAFALGAQ